MALEGKILTPIICFDTIFSKEVGLIKFIQDVCIDDQIFDLNAIKNMSDREILSLLQSRRDSNPLSIFSINGDVNDVYNDLMGNYQDIIVEKYAPTTDFIYPVIAYESKSFNGINPYILVSSCIEEKKVRSVEGLKNVNIIINDSINIGRLGKTFDPYYLNTYTDLYDNNLKSSFYERFVGKNIYLANTTFNQDFIEKKEYGSLSPENAFTLINIWRKDTNKNDGNK